MNPVCLFFAAVFLAAGILFSAGKGHVRVSAWKALPEREKAKIKIRPLCRNIGGMIALCGLIFLAGGLWSAFQDRALTWAVIAWLVCAGADVYFIQKSGRYLQP